jgi:hypothetical protein
MSGSPRKPRAQDGRPADRNPGAAALRDPWRPGSLDGHDHLASNLTRFLAPDASGASAKEKTRSTAGFTFPASIISRRASRYSPLRWPMTGTLFLRTIGDRNVAARIWGTGPSTCPPRPATVASRPRRTRARLTARSERLAVSRITS